MKLDLESKVALVTAASGGIGQEIARSLAAEGATVVVNGRTRQSVDHAIADIRAGLPQARLIPLVADNGTAAGCAETIDQLPVVGSAGQPVLQHADPQTGCPHGAQKAGGRETARNIFEVTRS